jgi:hypothetical protein
VRFTTEGRKTIQTEIELTASIQVIAAGDRLIRTQHLIGTQVVSMLIQLEILITPFSMSSLVSASVIGVGTVSSSSDTDLPLSSSTAPLILAT